MKLRFGSRSCVSSRSIARLLMGFIDAGSILLVSSCGRAPSADAGPPADAVAIVGNSVITLERFKREALVALSGCFGIIIRR